MTGEDSTVPAGQPAPVGDPQAIAGSAYDASMLADTTPPSRWLTTVADAPTLRESVYDANLAIDTTPPTRWEPPADTGTGGASGPVSTSDDR
jgi:hypothetical protein